MTDGKKLFDADATLEGIRAIAGRIAARFPGKESNIAIVGIHQMGVPIAELICRELQAQGIHADFGKLDITMYRDDIGSRSLLPRIYETDIPFDVNDKNIILVDDVLSSGRTIRAALDALTDFGRPGMIKLAVLVDRGEPEFPIHADFAAYSVSIPPEHKVLVTIGEDTAVYEVEWK
ncbi:MAG: bifunctional pyr operon transcriptional regulator/uracil phosphoribosyltransferase PyrR [Lentisphaeria bacterium]|nr:bifunctional pyr operon transcriptional regulator/uracil phosphoribosyltransferase PyrR [Lentisphaeria bacterium]